MSPVEELREIRERAATAEIDYMNEGLIPHPEHELPRAIEHGLAAHKDREHLLRCLDLTLEALDVSAEQWETLAALENDPVDKDIFLTYARKARQALATHAVVTKAKP